MKRPIWIRGLALVLAVLLSGCGGVAEPTESEAPLMIITLPTESVAETMSEAERNQVLRQEIDQAVSEWFAGDISFAEISVILIDIQDKGSEELADYAKLQLDYVTLENEGNTLLEMALKYLDAQNYVRTFTQLNDIDHAYSRYDLVLDLYQTCENQLLNAVAEPGNVQEFESYIQLLDNCLKLYNSKAFTERKRELSEEFPVFIEITDIVNTATAQFDSQHFEESFVLLALGLEKYPDNEILATTLVNYRDHYVISIVKRAVELCEQERYKDALLLVDTAINEHDCDEFQMLCEAIKEEKSFLYRAQNDIVAAFTSFTNDWQKEKFDVRQAANDTGAYIIKSGKKLVLGDYSDENITLLSFGGNIAASLLGADTFFDLRDLSYDITHWGEEEYFVVWLAADVIALLPVIGVVKYFNHFKKTASGAEATTELVDSVADVGKNADDTADLVDTISDITKLGDDIADTIDHAQDAHRAGEAAKDIVTDVIKEYELIETVNQNLVNSVHKSGVRFELSKIELSDGRKIMGVFPRFESVVDIELPKALYKEDFSRQQKECLDQLREMLKNPFSKLRKQFTEDQIDDIMNGIMPEGFTWHHNEQEGLMQLVETSVHAATGHTGGMSIWGKGY